MSLDARETTLPVESERKPRLADFLTAVTAYLELTNTNINKKNLATLGWANEVLLSNFNHDSDNHLLAKTIQRTIETLKNNPDLEEKMKLVESSQEGFQLLAEAAGRLLKNELITNNTKAIENFIETHGLYFLHAGGETYQFDNDRLVAYLSKHTHLFVGSSESQIAKKVKEALETALAEDINKFESMADLALPVYSKEKFNLIEIEHHDPFKLIKRSLNHIRELVQVMKGTSRRETLFMPTTEKLLGGGTWLQSLVQSSKNVTQAFNYLVEHFWPYQVGRFVLRKSQDSDDEEWVELAKADEALDKKGYFPVNKLVDKNFSDRLHCVGAVAWSTLRTQIIDRREDYRNGVSVSPLPERKNEGYWVVVENDLDDNAAFKKVHIPWEVVAGPDATFEAFYTHFAQAFSESPAVNDLKKASRIESLLKENINYDSAEHKQNRQDFHNVVDADVRIIIDRLTSKNKGVKHLLTAPAANPVGSRTPTVISLMVLPLADQKGEAVNLKAVTEISSHRPADGSYIENKELKRILEGIVSGETSKNPVDKRHTLEMPAVKDPNDPETIERPLEEEKMGEAYEIMLGHELNDLTGETISKKSSLIQSLYKTCRAGKGETTLYDRFKEEFDLRLNVHTLFSMALLHTLDIKHAHFLEKDGDSITPVPVVLPSELKRLIVMLEKDRLNQKVTFYPGGGSMTEDNPDIDAKTFLENQITEEKIRSVDLKNIAQGFSLFSKGRFEFARRAKINKNGKFKIGAGPIEVLKIAAGPARKFLTGLAKFTIPEANRIATNSLLISCLTNSSSGTRSFGSAIDSVYAEQGSVAVSDFAENAWRIVLRTGSLDLLKKKYGDVPDLEKRFQADLSQAILDIMVGLNTVFNQKDLDAIMARSKAA